MIRTFTAVLLALAIVPTALRAQTPISQDSLLDRMVGRWVLQGTIARQQTTHDVDFEWVLSHGYLQMHEVSREKDASGAPQYEAIVYFYPDKTTGEYAVLWLDNTAAGPFKPDGVGHGKREGDSIPLLFRSEGTLFHNTMIYNRQNDTWQWQMDNDDGRGQISPFARVTLTRKK